MYVENIFTSLEPLKNIINGFQKLNNNSATKGDFVFSFQVGGLRVEIKSTYPEKCEGFDSLFIAVCENEKKIVLSGDVESNTILLDGVLFPVSMQNEFFVSTVVWGVILLASVLDKRVVELVSMRDYSIQPIAPMFENAGFEVKNKEPFILRLTLPVAAHEGV